MDKLINTEHFKHRLEAAIKSNKEMDYLDFMRICYLLDTEPAAFDKEKVIEELKNTTGDIHFTEDGSFNGKIIEDFNFIQAKTAISIVEKGGIENDRERDD